MYGCNIFIFQIESQQLYVSNANQSFCNHLFVYAAMFCILTNGFLHSTTHIVVHLLIVFIHFWKKKVVKKDLCLATY